MVIDFHTHTFPEKIAFQAIEKLSKASHTKPFTDGTDAGLIRSMKEAGISKSVVLPVATNPDKVPSINDKSAALNGKDGLIYFGCMHPDFQMYKEEMHRIKSLGLKGIKIHPVYQGTDINDIRFLNILDIAGQLGLTVVTHSGDDIGFPGVVHCSPEMVLSALNQVGDVTIVLAHMGGWNNWNIVEEILSRTNAFIDTSFSLGKLTPIDDYYNDKKTEMLNAEQFVKIIRSFGSKRVLFGTDSPWSDQKAYLDEFLSLPLFDDEKSDILYKNAEKLL